MPCGGGRLPFSLSFQPCGIWLLLIDWMLIVTAPSSSPFLSEAQGTSVTQAWDKGVSRLWAGVEENSSRLGHHLKEAWTRPTLSTVKGDLPDQTSLTENTVATEHLECG